MLIKLIIGLGNNDPKYAMTYHNVGFLMADYLAAKDYKIPVIKLKGPMNESGVYTREILKTYHIAPENTLFIHDDSDITIGAYKLSIARGSAGHKGVQDIIDVLQTTHFMRLRIGIRPASKNNLSPRLKAGTFVLKKISKAHQKIFARVFAETATILEKPLSA